MKRMIPKLSLLLMILGGCSSMPKGPSVMVLPAPGKPFDQFTLEDTRCRQYAAQQVGMSPEEHAHKSLAASSALGTALGAGAGAAIGAATGSPGAGAAIGAGGGLLMGTASGAGASQSSGDVAQRHYDIAYQQCMYAYGNQVPGAMPQVPPRNVPPPPLPR